jgi:glucosamine-6-phosphate deaminase
VEVNDRWLLVLGQQLGAGAQTRAPGPKVQILHDNQEVGQSVAATFIDVVGRVLDGQESVSVMLAAAPSQLSFFRALCGQRERVDWDRVRLFHMDEYIGLPASHPASFRSFLHENLVDVVRPREFNEIHGDAADAGEEMVRYTQVLRSVDLDVCVMGIGENGHLAFNEPPADFRPAYEMQIVKLDDVTRRQEFTETPFDSIGDVPTHALTVTIPTLLSAKHLFVIVIGTRKADIVSRALTGSVDESVPASILARYPHALVFLDTDASSQLAGASRGA